MLSLKVYKKVEIKSTKGIKKEDSAYYEYET